jgi:hypothetical protein
MSRILASFAAFALLFILALPGPANAAERKADGLRTASEMTDVSAHRRRYRHRHVVRRHLWGPPVGYWGGYRSYAYDPYYYRPYWGSRAYVGGPGIGFGVGFGPRFWW